MNIAKTDLNLLIYLDVLLKEGSVTRAAERLNITQPAMSHALKRLREHLKDPILVRSSTGMLPTPRAKQLQPLVRHWLATMEENFVPEHSFDAKYSNRMYRIMVSDYAASTLVPSLLNEARDRAPDITLDVITPSDITVLDIENGNVDLAINVFKDVPQSFHAKSIWEDSFSCVLRDDLLFAKEPTLENYLAAQHVWVSKTGYGVAVGIAQADIDKSSRVDEALAEYQMDRQIKVFTRSYHVALHIVKEQDLIATVPTRAAKLVENQPGLVVLPAPFSIPPLHLRMIWSPLLHQDPGHRWLRDLIMETLSDNR